MSAYSLQNRHNWYFWYKFAKQGYTFLTNFCFTKFGLGKGVPGLHPRAKFHLCGFKNVGLQPQNREKW